MSDSTRRVYGLSFPVYSQAGTPIEAPRLLWARNRLMRRLGEVEAHQLIVLLVLDDRQVDSCSSSVLLDQLAMQFDQDAMPLDAIGYAGEGRGENESETNRWSS